MPKIVVFLGIKGTLGVLSGFEEVFEMQGYKTYRADSYAKFETLLAKYSVSLVICYAYGDMFSKYIDEFEGILPPIIYWYIQKVDQVPNRNGVTALSSVVLTSTMLQEAKKLLTNN